MPDIDPVSTSYFFAAQTEQSRELAKKRKNVTGAKSRQGLFSSLLETSKDELDAQGIEVPPEVAKLSYEDAIVTLKDALDVAGDALKTLPSADNFVAYKKTVKNFMSYVLNKNYDVQENLLNMKVKENGVWVSKEKKLVLVKAIDEKLDKLALDVLSNHADKLHMLAKIEEINGIVIDLLR